jgi:ABC-type glycerol-3-phosphate transport system permease component
MFTSGALSESVRTLPLGLGNLAVAAQYHTDYGMLFAGIVMVTLPILLVYLLLQKHLVKGITAGALKG